MHLSCYLLRLTKCIVSLTIFLFFAHCFSVSEKHVCIVSRCACVNWPRGSSFLIWKKLKGWALSFQSDNYSKGPILPSPGINRINKGQLIGSIVFKFQICGFGNHLSSDPKQCIVLANGIVKGIKRKRERPWERI